MATAEPKNIAASSVHQALRRAEMWGEFGPRKYRITHSGIIEAYGPMPNSNRRGWWFYGHVNDTCTLARLGIDS
jgi:hypothetical protein